MRIVIVSAGLLAIAACSPATSTAPAIDGTYKADVASAKLSTRPTVFAVKDGQYTCSSCTPPFTLAADGKTHPVAGRDAWDSASVRVVDPATIEMIVFRKGAEVGKTVMTVSADGKTLTRTNTSSDNASGKALTNASKSKRTGPAPAGAHATSGEWVSINEGAQIAAANLVATLSMKDGNVSMKLGSGESYTAKLGGPQVPLAGDTLGTTVAVTTEGKGFKETDYLNGKAIGEYTYTPVDAGTVTMKAHNLKTDSTDEYTLKKQ